MGVPTSEVGYTAAMPRREDHEVHKDMWWHWTTTTLFSNLVTLHTYLPMKMEQIECSETSAYETQTPWNYPEESKV